MPSRAYVCIIKYRFQNVNDVIYMYMRQLNRICQCPITCKNIVLMLIAFALPVWKCALRYVLFYKLFIVKKLIFNLWRLHSSSIQTIYKEKGRCSLLTFVIKVMRNFKNAICCLPLCLKEIRLYILHDTYLDSCFENNWSLHYLFVVYAELVHNVL